MIRIAVPGQDGGVTAGGKAQVHPVPVSLQRNKRQSSGSTVMTLIQSRLAVQVVGSAALSTTSLKGRVTFLALKSTGSWVSCAATVALSALPTRAPRKLPVVTPGKVGLLGIESVTGPVEADAKI